MCKFYIKVFMAYSNISNKGSQCIFMGENLINMVLRGEGGRDGERRGCHHCGLVDKTVDS